MTIFSTAFTPADFNSSLDNDGMRYLQRLILFFFSSRRRHTRSLCDWSSDVCSSDLSPAVGRASSPVLLERLQVARFYHEDSSNSYPLLSALLLRRDQQISLIQKRR